MLIIFYFLLMLRVGRGSDGLIFETKVVSAGDDVTLTCERQKSSNSSELFWIRLVSGNFPEVLGGRFISNPDKIPHITTKSEDGGTLTLHIQQSTRTDSGVYYCFQVNVFKLTFLKGAFLRIKGTDHVTAIIQEPPSGPVHPGSSETLKCSVHYDSENKPCPGDHMVFWFRAGSQESHPSVLYAEGNSSDGSVSPQRCSYTSSRTISSSDAGTYYCAVASCGEILFGKGTKVDDQQGTSVGFFGVDHVQNIIIVLLCAVLAVSVIVIASLIYVIKKISHEDEVSLQENMAKKHFERDGDKWIYSAAVFTVMKTDGGGTRDGTEREKIYAAVKAFGLD